MTIVLKMSAFILLNVARASFKLNHVKINALPQKVKYKANDEK